MREILFRGKRIDINEWIEGYYAVSPTDSKSYIYAKDYTEVDIAEDGLHVAYRLMQVIPETVGQFVGLTDKNGNKIFEGDCFKTYCTGLPVYKHIVGYYPEHFAFMARCVEMNTIHYLSDYSPSAIKVIGNIYDNPELLEVVEQ